MADDILAASGYLGLPPAPPYDILHSEDDPRVRELLRRDWDEPLPNYTSNVYKFGLVSRKQELSSPGLQSPNRAWKKVYLEVNNTQLNVYSPKEIQIPPLYAPLAGSHSSPARVPSSSTLISSGSHASPTRPPLSFSALKMTHDNSTESASIPWPSVPMSLSSSVGSQSTARPRDNSLSRSLRNALQIHRHRNRSLSNASTASTFSNGSTSSFNDPGTPIGQEIDQFGFDYTPTGTPGTPGSISHYLSLSNDSLDQSEFSDSPYTSLCPETSQQLAMLNRTVPIHKVLDLNREYDRREIPEIVKFNLIIPHQSQINIIKQQSKLKKSYSLQYAVVGLAIDYTKKPYVLRLRLEQEQFLIHCYSIENLLDWYTVITAGRDIASPLENRVLTDYRRRTENRRNGVSYGNPLLRVDDETLTRLKEPGRHPEAPMTANSSSVGSSVLFKGKFNESQDSFAGTRSRSSSNPSMRTQLMQPHPGSMGQIGNVGNVGNGLVPIQRLRSHSEQPDMHHMSRFMAQTNSTADLSPLGLSAVGSPPLGGLLDVPGRKRINSLGRPMSPLAMEMLSPPTSDSEQQDLSDFQDHETEDLTFAERLQKLKLASETSAEAPVDHPQHEDAEELLAMFPVDDLAPTPKDLFSARSIETVGGSSSSGHTTFLSLSPSPVHDPENEPGKEVWCPGRPKKLTHEKMMKLAFKCVASLKFRDEWIGRPLVKTRIQEKTTDKKKRVSVSRDSVKCTPGLGELNNLVPDDYDNTVSYWSSVSVKCEEYAVGKTGLVRMK